jgi:hypothetical protein
MRVRYLPVEDNCSGCPYCGHSTTFPKDLQIWCMSEQVELVNKGKMDVQNLKKVLNSLGVPSNTIHFVADG